MSTALIRNDVTGCGQFITDISIDRYLEYFVPENKFVKKQQEYFNIYMYHSPVSMYEITKELWPQFVQHLAIEGHPSVMTILYNFRLR